MRLEQRIFRLKAFLFFLHSGMAIMVSFLPVYLKSLGLSGTEVGWLVAVGPIASIISQPFWGYLSDKFQTVKWTSVIGIALGLLVSIVLFRVNTFLPLMVLMYIFYSFIAPVVALGDSMTQRTADEFGLSFGYVRTWGSVGFASSALITGQIFNAIGVQSIFWPYFLYMLGALFLCLALVDVRTKHQSVTFRDAVKAGRRPSLVIFFIVVLIISITHRANDSFLGLYIYELDGNDAQIGWAWFVGVLSEGVIFATSALWMKRFHELTIITIAGLIYTFRWFLFAILNDPIQLIFLQTIQGLGFAVLYVAAFQFVSKLVPEELQSTGHLLFVTVFFGIAGIISGVFGGYILEVASARVLYHYLGYIALAGSIGMFAYQHFYHKHVKTYIH